MKIHIALAEMKNTLKKNRIIALTLNGLIILGMIIIWNNPPEDVVRDILCGLLSLFLIFFIKIFITVQGTAKKRYETLNLQLRIQQQSKRSL